MKLEGTGTRSQAAQSSEMGKKGCEESRRWSHGKVPARLERARKESEKTNDGYDHWNVSMTFAIDVQTPLKRGRLLTLKNGNVFTLSTCWRFFIKQMPFKTHHRMGLGADTITFQIYFAFSIDEHNKARSAVDAQTARLLTLAWGNLRNYCHVLGRKRDRKNRRFFCLHWFKPHFVSVAYYTAI